MSQTADPNALTLVGSLFQPLMTILGVAAVAVYVVVQWRDQRTQQLEKAVNSWRELQEATEAKNEKLVQTIKSKDSVIRALSQRNSVLWTAIMSSLDLSKLKKDHENELH